MKNGPWWGKNDKKQLLGAIIIGRKLKLVTSLYILTKNVAGEKKKKKQIMVVYNLYYEHH